DLKKRVPGGETTLSQLTEVLYRTQTDNKPIPGFDPDRHDTQYYRAQQAVDCDEVYPGIYIGDAHSAMNKKYLKTLGITHLLNAAEGKRFGFVDTDRYYYADTTIKYLGLPLDDSYTTDISKYFNTAASFIDEAVSTGGKAFVHCVMGISRSATCVIAYLMIKKGMHSIDALRTVRKNRHIKPNVGFLQQLAELNNELQRKACN
ncbi:Dual specificity phosphatase DUPD1, partial [Habropoda laboriosa]